MKVIPHIKSKVMKPNEARIIIVNESAIEELLLENLMEKGSDYFDVEHNPDKFIYVMNMDKSNALLTYAVMPIEYCFNGYSLNFDYIREKIGVTTKSLFMNKRYRSLTITEETLTPKDC